MPIARFLAELVVAHAHLYNGHVLPFRAIHLEQEMVACSGVSRVVYLHRQSDSFTLYLSIDV